MVIDMHTHFVPSYFPDMSEFQNSQHWPKIETMDENKYKIMINGQEFRVISDDCWNAQTRLRDMDEEGISHQVISPMPILCSYWFEANAAMEFSRFINSELSKLVKQSDRFYGIGTLPLQDPELAASELSRLKSEYGLLGVQVGSNINGRPIGDPYFLPFFKAVESENLCIFIHPLQPTGKDRIVGPPSLEGIVNFQAETAFAVTSIITGGLLEECPNLRIAASHGGGSYATVHPRLVQGWHFFKDFKDSLVKSPEVYASKLYFDTLVYNDKTLNHLIDMFGTDVLMVGSDYPFLIREKNPGDRIKQSDLSETVKQDILYKNCLRFLGVTS